MRRLDSQIFDADLRGWIRAQPEEAIALLQHFGWPTPYLDLTDKVEIALFFACDGYNEGDGPAEIIIVDRSLLGKGIRVVGHHEVVDPALNLRWTRQRGFALLPPGWPGLIAEEEADILIMDGVTRLAFLPDNDAINWAAAVRPWVYGELPEIKNQIAFLVNELAKVKEFSLHPDLKRFPF